MALLEIDSVAVESVGVSAQYLLSTSMGCRRLGIREAMTTAQRGFLDELTVMTSISLSEVCLTRAHRSWSLDND